MGFTVFLGFLTRLFLSLSALLALTARVAVRNLGDILTGSATDVGTGPVLILLARHSGRPAVPAGRGAGSLAPLRLSPGRVVGRPV